MPFRLPGSSAGTRPLALEVTRILDEVPPHLVPDQLVAEARRVAGVAVALYVVDIDGSQLLRLAGSEEFPDRLEDRRRSDRRSSPRACPRSTTGSSASCQAASPEPLWLRGRVTGLLLCVGNAAASLADIAKQGAAALELASELHRLHRGGPAPQADHAGRGGPAAPAPAAHRPDRRRPARRRRCFPPTRSAAIGLTSSRTATVPGWRSQTPPATGRPPPASAPPPWARCAPPDAAARSRGRAPERRRTVRHLGNPDFYITAMMARWRAATATLTWVNCGHPQPTWSTSTAT